MMKMILMIIESAELLRGGGSAFSVALPLLPEEVIKVCSWD